MIRALLFLVCVFLAPVGTNAQLMTMGIGQGDAGGGGPVYSGPGDVVSGASMWWGLRAYNAAYIGNKLINVIQTSNSHTCDILAASNGGLGNTANCSTGGDNGQSAASFCGSTCNIDEAYDQTGNGNHILQATQSFQPLLVFNCIGALPCLQFTNGEVLTAGANFTPATGVLSLSTVGNRASGTGITSFVKETPSNRFVGNNGVANKWALVATGNFAVTATDASWHAGNAVTNGTSSVVNIDGSETTGSLTANTTAGAPVVGANSGTAMDWAEAGAWDNVAFTGTQRTNLCHNQFTYWGTSTSC